MSDVFHPAQFGERPVEPLSGVTADQQRAELLPARETLLSLPIIGDLLKNIPFLSGLLKSDRALKKDATPVDWTR
jgi:hypothetical protein